MKPDLDMELIYMIFVKCVVLGGMVLLIDEILFSIGIYIFYISLIQW